MADVKVIVKQMKDAGMSDADILSNLQELGIENAESELAKILKEVPQPARLVKPAANEEGKIRITKIDGDSEQTVDIRNILEGGGTEEVELMKKVADTNVGNADELEDKLDQIIALLKALQDINKKILETNRDLLVKLNKKTQEGEKPTLGKLF